MTSDGSTESEDGVRRGAHRSPPEATQTNRVDDAYAAMTFAQGSINSADGKASIIAAAATVMVGLIATSVDLRLLGTGTAGEVLAALAGILALISILGVGIELGGVVVPRVGAESFSRYVWPAIADVPVEDLVAARPDEDRYEAWAQARMLAKIARRKHVHLRRAMIWFAASVVVAAIWLLVTTAVSPAGAP